MAPNLFDEQIFIVERMLNRIPDDLVLPPTLTSGQALGHDVVWHRLSLKGALTRLLGLREDSHLGVDLVQSFFELLPPSLNIGHPEMID